MSPLDYILNRVGSSAAATEIYEAVVTAGKFLGGEAIETGLAAFAGAEVVSLFALTYSEHLGGWQNPEYINGYRLNTDGEWYTTPPNPFVGDYAWEGKASLEKKLELDYLRNLRIQTNNLEHLTPDVNNIQLDGYIKLVKDFLPAYLDAAGNWIGYHTPTSQEIKDAVATAFTTATAAVRRDPLTFDLDNDGIETTGVSTTSPILFDHDADGVKTSTGWVKPDDAFLVRDVNGNGTIDSGRELFGDATLKTNGQFLMRWRIWTAMPMARWIVPMRHLPACVYGGI